MTAGMAKSLCSRVMRSASDLRNVEYVVDDVEEVVGRVADLEQPPVGLGFIDLLLQKVGEADDGVHRGADLVAHIGQEGTFFARLPPRLRPLASASSAVREKTTLQMVAVLVQFGLGLFLVTDVITTAKLYSLPRWAM